MPDRSKELQERWFETALRRHRESARSRIEQLNNAPVRSVNRNGGFKNIFQTVLHHAFLTQTAAPDFIEPCHCQQISSDAFFRLLAPRDIDVVTKQAQGMSA